MQANWDEKYLSQVGHISHVNAGWKVPHSGETTHLQSWIKPNVILKNLPLYFHCSLFPQIQCRRLVVGALAESSGSRCLSHSLFNIEWGDRGDCRSVTLILSTIVWILKKSGKSLLMKTIKKKICFWNFTNLSTLPSPIPDKEKKINFNF